MTQTSSRAADSEMTDHALLLTPSHGLGGGIERYAATLELAFAEYGVDYQRIDLDQAGFRGHAQMLTKGSRYLRDSTGSTRIVLLHRTLLPVASLLARQPLISGITVVCHGTDIWGQERSLRRYIEKHLMRKGNVRIVAVSSFTSGVLGSNCMSTILSPGLSRSWFETLVSASTHVTADRSTIHLATAFRLADWRDKGLPELLVAIASLGRSDIYLTISGSGKPPPDLLHLIQQYPRCTVLSDLSDHELARQLANADLFVLATRTRMGRHASGEGFGLVLLEAQVAGTPVIAPAYGGSHDAYLNEVTGCAPLDESPEALARLLAEMLQDPQRLARMAKHASKWARESFAPEKYGSLAVVKLL